MRSGHKGGSRCSLRGRRLEGSAWRRSRRRWLSGRWLSGPWRSHGEHLAKAHLFSGYSHRRQEEEEEGAVLAIGFRFGWQLRHVFRRPSWDLQEGSRRTKGSDSCARKTPSSFLIFCLASSPRPQQSKTARASSASCWTLVGRTAWEKRQKQCQDAGQKPSQRARQRQRAALGTEWSGRWGGGFR